MKTVLLKTRYEDIPKGYSGAVFLSVMNDCDKVPMGEVMADIKANRNPGNHKRFFAFVNQSFDMQDEFDEKDIWRKYITMKAGFFDEVVTAKGVQYWPRSISWDELDEIEFKDLFSKVTNAFIRYYGQDLNEIQLNSILEF